MKSTLLRCGLLWLITGAAQAFNVNPKYIELVMPAGGSYTGLVEVTNESAIPEQITVDFIDKTTGSHHGTPWLSTHPQTLDMPPGHTNFVPFTVTLPAEASGEFRGRMGFLKENIEESGGPFGIKTKTSISIYAIVSGTERYDGLLRGFSLSKGSRRQYELLVENKGNVHHRARGKGQIRAKASTNILTTFTINQTQAPFYADQTNRVVGLLDIDLPAGNYLVDIQLPFPDETLILTNQYQLRVK